jgi:pyruvate carboxylase
MRLGIDAAKKAGGVVEAVVCYSGDVASPKETKYTLQYYLDFIDKLVQEGVHILGVKDMAGLLKPEAAKLYTSSSLSRSQALTILAGLSARSGRSTPTFPSMSTLMTPLELQQPACSLRLRLVLILSMLPLIVRHSHLRTTRGCSEFLIGMSGLTSQPSMGAICMALEQTRLGTGIRYADIQALNLYWSQVRMLYSCFEANVRASDSSVFDHEMPGGQYTNLMVRMMSGKPIRSFTE